MYAVLAEKATRQRKLPISSLIARHYSSYLCGSYLGCDIQTLPEAICVDTGMEVGYGTVPLERSPLTGGKVRPWSLKFGDSEFRPRDIHRLFYGRSHLVFGWDLADRQHTVPWDHLADYIADVVTDAIELFGPGHRQLAYLFGWAAHIVGDSLIKSIHEGIDLFLLDGKYTQRNRPVQDLVTFHEIGRKELRLNWPDLMADLVATPVEPIQAHYMRLTKRRGQLGKHYPNAWTPQAEKLIWKVLGENRRYQRIRNGRLLKQLALTKTKNGWQCDSGLSQRTGGLSYQEMIEAAEKANFRHALWQMGEAIADLFEQVVQRQPLLEHSPDDNPSWSEITKHWKNSRK
jgi:hypothetical protein